MKNLRAVALIGLTAFPLIGCQSLVRPESEREAALAVGVGNAIEFHTEALPDQDDELISGALSLPEAIRRGLKTDPSIQAALAKVRVAEAESAQTRLLPNPILTLAFRLPESGGQPIVDVSIAMELLSLIKKPGQVKVADFRLRSASSEAVVAVLDVVSEIRQRYAAVQSLDALVPILQERRKLLDRLIEIAKSRLGAGEGIRLDVTTLEAQLADLEVEIIEQQSERQQQRLQLSRLIGRPVDAAQWEVTPWAEPPQISSDETAWLGAALEHRPELQVKLWELSALGVEARLARLAFLDGAESSLDAERDGTWSIGPSMGVALPIFDWGQEQQSKIAALRSQTFHELTQQRRKVIEETRTTRVAFQASLEAYKRVRDRLIPLLEKRRSEANSQWETGHSDILPLILADQELQAAKARRIDFERKTMDSLIQLERAVGGPAHVPTAVPSTAPSTAPSTTTTSPKE